MQLLAHPLLYCLVTFDKQKNAPTSCTRLMRVNPALTTQMPDTNHLTAVITLVVEVWLNPPLPHPQNGKQFFISWKLVSLFLSPPAPDFSFKCFLARYLPPSLASSSPPPPSLPSSLPPCLLPSLPPSIARSCLPSLLHASPLAASIHPPSIHPSIHPSPLTTDIGQEVVTALIGLGLAEGRVQRCARVGHRVQSPA